MAAEGIGPFVHVTEVPGFQKVLIIFFNVNIKTQQE